MNPAPPKPPASSPAEPDDAAPARPDMVTGEPVRIDTVVASAYTIPTDVPEADGTFAWNDTTLVLVQVSGSGQTGTGWTYGSAVAVRLIDDVLAPALIGQQLASVPQAWDLLVRRLRNIGRPGIAAMALSAVDCALWDLTARAAGLPLHEMLGARRGSVPLYGSGGFTSYTDDQLQAQLAGWADFGFTAVKIKVGEDWGSNQTRDLDRTLQARTVIGPDRALFVDANGGYRRQQVEQLAPEFADLGVVWWEEPVSSDDYDGLRAARTVFPGDVAAGEYGYDLAYFRHLCDAEAVDCVQVDVTRCGGITELLRIAHLVGGYGLEISGHCAPHLHAAVLAAVANLRHLEWFHDHARVEQLLLDGGPHLVRGELVLHPDAAGHGMTWRAADAERYRVA
jgi:L-alanine-DL-glutamate epimerase-like enolase superfamily enzyme